MIPFLSSPKSSNTALMSVKINFKQVRSLILELNFRSQSNSCIHCIHVSFCQLDCGWSLLGRGDNCKLHLVYIAFMGHHSFLNFLNILFEFHDFQGIWLTVIDFFFQNPELFYSCNNFTTGQLLPLPRSTFPIFLKSSSQE